MPRLTITELAALAHMTEASIRYRVRRRQMTSPDRHGRFDRRRALAELAVKRKQRGGRKSGPTKLVEARRTLHDPAERFRLAKARQEEIKLRRMRNQSVDLKAAQRRAFHIVRMWRDIEDASVSREAPLLAARLGVEEGKMWRELKGFVRGVQEACGRLDIDKALATDPAEDGETGEGGD
jgi:hypothetical protein